MAPLAGNASSSPLILLKDIFIDYLKDLEKYNVEEKEYEALKLQMQGLKSDQGRIMERMIKVIDFGIRQGESVAKPISYAEITKRSDGPTWGPNSGMTSPKADNPEIGSEMKKRHFPILTPKNFINGDAISDSMIWSRINASGNLEILSITGTRNGKNWLIKCANALCQTKVMNIMKDLMNEKGLPPEIPWQLNPKIQISGLDPKEEDSMIIEEIERRYKANCMRIYGNFHCKSVSRGKERGDKERLILEVSPGLRSRIWDDQGIYIQSRKRRVFDVFNVLQCWNCGQLGHKAKKKNIETNTWETNCRNKKACFNCGIDFEKCTCGKKWKNKNVSTAARSRAGEFQLHITRQVWTAKAEGG